MLKIPFPSDQINIILKLIEEFENNKILLEINEEIIFQILECCLFLNINILLKHFLPKLALNIKKIPINLFLKFPLKLKKKLLNLIPISIFNIDYLINIFDFNDIYNKFNFIPISKQIISPFLLINKIPNISKFQDLANKLIEINSQNIKTNFCQNYCNILKLNKIIEYNLLKNLQFLTLYDIILEDNFLLYLNLSLIKLEIIKIKLLINKILLILNFLKNSHLEILILRDNKIGSKGSLLFSDFFFTKPNLILKFLDLSSNSIGASSLFELLKSIEYINLKGLSIDGNLFQPSSNCFLLLPNLKLKYFSLRAIHWDYPTAEIIKKTFLENKIKWWDLSAQIIHQNSDPDLSSEMVEDLFLNSPLYIKYLYFSNHRFEKISLKFLLKMNLKELTLSNSNLINQNIDEIIPLINNLKYLDLSSNTINFKNNDFFLECSKSLTLNYLNLSKNIIGDNIGSNFFNFLIENNNFLKILKLSHCGLLNKTTINLFKLLSLGKMEFEELDLSANLLFKKTLLINNNLKKTKIKKLIIGASEPKIDSLNLLFNLITNLEILDVHNIKFNIFFQSYKNLKNIPTLNLSFTQIKNEKNLFQIIKDLKVRILYVINSLSTNNLIKFLCNWSEIPYLCCIYLGESQNTIQNSKIPILIDGKY